MTSDQLVNNTPTIIVVIVVPITDRSIGCKRDLLTDHSQRSQIGSEDGELALANPQIHPVGLVVTGDNRVGIGSCNGICRHMDCVVVHGHTKILSWVSLW